MPVCGEQGPQQNASMYDCPGLRLRVTGQPHPRRKERQTAKKKKKQGKILLPPVINPQASAALAHRPLYGVQ